MKLQTTLGTWLTAAALCLCSAGCGDDSESGDEDGRGTGHGDAGTADDEDGDEIEIAGTWTSGFGQSDGDVMIDSEVWHEETFESEIVEFDNDENFAITRNPDDAEYMPGKFSKIVWLEPDDEGFFYCIVDFDLDTAEDAANSDKTADDSDPEHSGCGDFGWTKLTQ